MSLEQEEKPKISKEEKAGHFLEKAAELFARKGYSRCSVDELAAHIGLSKGGLYWHFSSKEDLYSRICIKFCTEHQNMLQEMMQNKDLSLDSAVRAGRTLMELMLHDSEQVSLFTDFSVQSRRLPKVREAMEKLDLQWERILSGLGDKLQKAGIIGPDADIGRIARWCVVFFEGLLFQYSIFGNRERVLKDWEEFLRTLLSA